MVKCPYCGEEVSPEEYIGHVSKHEAGALKSMGGERTQLKRYLDDMKKALVRRDVDTLMRAGMEGLVEVGRLYEQKGFRGFGPIYNGITIAVLSANKGDWAYVESSINGAIRDLEQF